MKKSILNIGNALNKAELKQINGGKQCNTNADCTYGRPFCNLFGYCVTEL
jgi:hypothetical protein